MKHHRVSRHCKCRQSGVSVILAMALQAGLFMTDALAVDCEVPELYKPVTEAPVSDVKQVFRSHAIAMHGEPKYPAGFSHFDYVNPDAPKGGRLALAQRGTFDSFNVYIDKGNPVSTGSIETLTVQSDDEAFTQYGLLAETIEWPHDRSWVTFYLNPAARWHDGVPVTADDVIWTFNALVEQGQPFYKYYYASVENVEKLSSRAVKFTFSEASNRELPLIIGQLPVLPRHYWASRDFNKTTLEPPLGSGPYRIRNFDAGRFLTLERVEDYWGKQLPVRLGTNNFDTQHLKFYRDDTAIRLSLKSFDTDLRIENQAKAWALDYDIPATRKGWLKKRRFATSRTQGMQAFILNLRRPLFQNIKLREALDIAFDFEWSNTNLFFGEYTRSNSFWSNSELAARGEPEGEELEILDHYKACLPDTVFSIPYEPPVTDGKGWSRGSVVKAATLLEQAGYEVQNFRLVNKESGVPLEFEILYSSPTLERVILPYISNLLRLGIKAKARIVDQSQYVTRLRDFDFDMIWGGWGQSESPGNEQRDFFSSAAADNPASRNYAGISNPVIDQLIELIIQATSRESLVARTRALDRVLLAQRYVIPNWHLPAVRMVYWDKFGMPSVLTKDGPLISAWWHDEKKAVKLAAAIAEDTTLLHPADTEKKSGRDITEPVSTEDGSRLQRVLLVIVLIVLVLIAWLSLSYKEPGK